jgi:hypothetical protein
MELLYRTVRKLLCVALFSGTAARLANRPLKWCLNKNF